MTKAEVISKTLREIAPLSVCNQPPFSEEQDQEEFIVSVLQDVLPDGLDLKTCDDFKHLGPECCETCHCLYPHYEMSIVEWPDGGKAWVCDVIKEAIRQIPRTEEPPTALSRI